MHTTSGVDAIDEYLETVEKKDGRWMYRFGREMRPVAVSEITVPYKTGDKLAEKKFTIYRTQHGPVVRQEDGKWMSFRIMQEPVKALEQSYLRTKARDYKSYKQTMELSPTPRTTPCLLPRKAISLISTVTTSRGETRASTGPNPWTGAIRQLNTRVC